MQGCDHRWMYSSCSRRTYRDAHSQYSQYRKCPQITIWLPSKTFSILVFLGGVQQKLNINISIFTQNFLLWCTCDVRHMGVARWRQEDDDTQCVLLSPHYSCINVHVLIESHWIIIKNKQKWQNVAFSFLFFVFFTAVINNAAERGGLYGSTQPWIQPPPVIHRPMLDNAAHFILHWRCSGSRRFENSHSKVTQTRHSTKDHGRTDGPARLASPAAAVGLLNWITTAMWH